MSEDKCDVKRADRNHLQTKNWYLGF